MQNDLCQNLTASVYIAINLGILWDACEKNSRRKKHVNQNS